MASAALIAPSWASALCSRSFSLAGGSDPSAAAPLPSAAAAVASRLGGRRLALALLLDESVSTAPPPSAALLAPPLAVASPPLAPPSCSSFFALRASSRFCRGGGMAASARAPRLLAVEPPLVGEAVAVAAVVGEGLGGGGGVEALHRHVTPTDDLAGVHLVRQRQADLDAPQRVEDALVRALVLEEELGERVVDQVLVVELAAAGEADGAPLGVVLQREHDVLVRHAVDLRAEGERHALELL